MKSNPIKIMHVINSLEVGEAEMMLYNLLYRMDRARYENIVVSISCRGAIAEWLGMLGIKVVSLETAQVRKVPQRLKKLKKLISEYDPDVIQIWMYHANWFG